MNHLSNTKLFCGFLAIALTFCFVHKSTAHFIWVYADDGKIKVVFGEGLEPDQAQFLDGLSGMKVFSVKEGNHAALELTKQTDGGEGWFEVPLEKAGNAVDLSCEYGVFGRGDRSMFLDYCAKYILFDGQTDTKKVANKLKLDIVPQRVDGKLKLTAYFDGKPLSGAEITAYQLESHSVDATTSDNGSVLIEPATRYVIRAKHVIAEAGEHDGQKFDEKRFYCTLVLDLPGTQSDVVKTNTQMSDSHEANETTLKPVDADLADLPLGLTSFGATILDDKIYVIGGKEGKAHSYAKSYQNRSVFSLNINSESPEWTTVGECLGLQGLAIVGYNGKLYRIGGLEARNAEGEEHDLHSVADFVEFNPDTKEWRELPKLPAGRSSFDACLVGSTIYVVGGWTMSGKEESTWCTDALSFDLNDPEAKWESFETPFKVRALAVRACNDKLYALGGIVEKGGPTAKMHIFDLKKKEWSEGPDIPAEGSMKAFGCSSAVVDNNLLVSTYDGGIYKLNADGKSWARIHELETSGRFFHQMLPIKEAQFVLVGGAHMEVGKIQETEVFEVLPTADKDVAQLKKEHAHKH